MLQAGYQNFRKAIDVKLLEAFTIKKSDTPKAPLFSGKLQSCDNNYIYVKIINANQEARFVNNDNMLFDITFNINRLTYQIQLAALQWVNEHRLFSILIANPLYSRTDKVVPTVNAEFLSPIFKGLNKEQKIAVKFMVEAHNRPLPYILFGPPGKQ